jgi:hypothetical protein
VLKALHTVHGRVPHLEYRGPSDLPQLAARFGARRVIAIQQGAIEEVAARVAVRLERGDDYLAQWLVVARTVREMIDTGSIAVWPRPFAHLPIPTSGMVQRALDIVLPDDHAMTMVLWSGTQPWTGVVLRRRRGEIDLVAGPDLIARWSGPLGGDWRRDHRFVNEGISRVVAPVHLGLYGEVASLRRLLRNFEPGAWARAVALRDIIVSPTPPYVAVAVAADAARAVAQRASEWLGGTEALEKLASVARLVRSRVTEIASVTQTLGFDPLQALATMLARSEEIGAEPSTEKVSTGAEHSEETPSSQR